MISKEYLKLLKERAEEIAQLCYKINEIEGNDKLIDSWGIYTIILDILYGEFEVVFEDSHHNLSSTYHIDLKYISDDTLFETKKKELEKEYKSKLEEVQIAKRKREIAKQEETREKELAELKRLGEKYGSCL